MVDEAGQVEIRGVRRFNRIVAREIGALTDQFLGRDRPMAESRILWEVGSEGAEVRELRARLSLDSGYLSRILRSLEGQGLVRVSPGPDDRRVRLARLTRAGLAERAELDRRSDDVAAGILGPLGSDQRARLVAAMGEVETLLRASMVRVDIEDPATAAARWCLDQYFEELDRRFPAGFDSSRSIPADDDQLRLPAGLLLIARLDGRAVGCGALKLHGDAPAELKRMWVAPDARGLGLGRRMLRELEQQAGVHRVSTLHLETNATLTEAIALYRSGGYTEVAAFNDEPYADHWFEKALLPPKD
jgi:DNA-binding MarR family transcriptional regulator/GNAT superfamily N-acetyltransferase